MVTGIRSDRIVLPDSILDGYLYMEDGRLLFVGPTPRPCDELLDFRGQYVAPGFIDLHTHGCAGVSYLSCTPEEARKALSLHMQHGATTVYPTLSTAPLEDMEAAVAVLATVMDDPLTPVTVPGVHMEGPYLSENQCGAQRPGMITPPIREAYTGLADRLDRCIARWDFAPERDEDQAFCKFLRQRGILPAVAHSDARYEELVPAIEEGCRLVTHLYSCTSTVTRDRGFRHLGIIETAFLRDDVDAEIIADGKHLPPELINMIVKIKGRDRVAMVTDSLEVAGLPVTDGIVPGSSCIVEDGVCKLPDRSAFAGSVALPDSLLRVAVKECGFSIVDGVYMLTATPARIMGLPKGRLEAGLDADLAVFDDSITINAVFTKGIRRI